MPGPLFVGGTAVGNCIQTIQERENGGWRGLYIHWHWAWLLPWHTHCPRAHGHGGETSSENVNVVIFHLGVDLSNCSYTV